MQTIGVLLTNTGTPDAPTTQAVRRYLREFLSDPRIVQLPRIIWLPILYGLVLTLRPKRSAALYKKIWTEQGSPMRFLMQKIAHDLQEKLATENYMIEVGMNYGSPSIADGLNKLRDKNVDRIVVLPLFPQYSFTTTASTYDHVKRAIKDWPTEKQATISPIQSYAAHPQYIQALAAQITHQWDKKGRAKHLLISFHGIPERFIAAGDPYQSECEQTATLLAKALQLNPTEWTLCYQSQFGYDKWLKPSTQALFTELPKRGIKNIDVVCPGFAVDCLETLEEIAIQGQQLFLTAGGESLRYLPALNDSRMQIDMLATLITPIT